MDCAAEKMMDEELVEEQVKEGQPFARPLLQIKKQDTHFVI